jgi:hypothetical protein
MIVYTVQIALTCEDCTESAFFKSISHREAAKVARAFGWHVKDKKALCPKHKQIQSEFRRREHAPRLGAQ